MSPHNSDVPTLGDVVSAAALVLGLITAWLYVTGWVYAYHYLDAFRIPMLMAELPKEHLFVYGGLVLWKNLVASFITALALFAIISASVLYRQCLRRFGIATTVVVLVLASFAAGRLGAVHTAGADFEAQQLRDFDAYPRFRLALQDAAAASTEQLADIARTDCGRLVLATKTDLFLIRPVRGMATVDTFVVPRSQVKALRIIATYSSCN